MADAKKTTVGELTGSRRHFSSVHLPEGIARAFGLKDEDSRVIHIEHHDEGISSAEIPFWAAFWNLKSDEEKRNRKR